MTPLAPPLPANSRLVSIASLASGGLFGLALARTVLDTWPALAGPLPRWPLALGPALGFAVLGRGLAFRTPTHAYIPLLLSATIVLGRSTPDLVVQWLLIVGAVCGAVVVILTTQYRIRNKNDDSPNSKPATQNFQPATLFPCLYPLSLALIAGGLYLRTLAPTVGEADTFEFQVNVLRLGISHGSGYPLYILLAKLFSLLPVGGTAAYRINLSSAFFGVTAALMCYGLARQLKAPRPAAWLGGFFLAVSIGVWSRAVEAEVYTLHVTLAGLLLWMGIRIQESGVRSQKDLAALAFVFGLSLTNHLTTALLAPALAIAVLPGVWRYVSTHSTRQARLLTAFSCLLTSCLSFALGLSVYLYLPLRWPAVNNGEAMTWDMFLRFFTGAEAHGALRLDAFYTDFSRYEIVMRKMAEQFSWGGLVLAFVGLWRLFQCNRRAALVTLTAWGAYAFFGLSFYVPDPDYSSFLLPAHWAAAVWMGYGIAAILNAKYKILNSLRVLVLCIGYSVFFLLASLLIPSNMPHVDQSTDWARYRLGQYILSQPLKQGAAILADSELIAPLYYLQVAEGVRPDLDIIVLPAEDHYRAELDARMSSGQPVYLGRYLPHLAEAYYLRSVGPLTEAKLEPSSLPDNITPVELDFGQIIRLHGFSLDSDSAAADDALRVTLYWQALAPPPNYLVSLRLVNTAGEPVIVGPGQAPVGQMYNTAAWPTDDVVADFQTLALDPSLAPGRYFLQVGLFPPFSAEGLPLEWGNTWLTLSAVTVTEPEADPQILHPLRMRFGNQVWLLGYDAPRTVTPGAPVSLRLYWQSRVDTQAEICLADRCTSVNVRAGERTTVTRTTLPAPEAGGEAQVRVGLPGVQAECGWWPPLPAEWCRVVNVSVEGEAIGAEAVNFDNQILLESLTIETPRAGRGQTVIVSAQWRGLRPMEADYTVFVHLLGPDGRVHGQVDMWPVQGTLPTTQWQVNAPVADRFEVRVPDDAPPGEYTVEVGWYLLATLDRLPVLNNGVAVDDKFVAHGLAITD